MRLMSLATCRLFVARKTVPVGERIFGEPLARAGQTLVITVLKNFDIVNSVSWSWWKIGVISLTKLK